MKEVPAQSNTQNNLFGVEETLDGVKFLTAVGIAVAASLKDDGKITGGDLLNFLEPVKELPGFIIGIDMIPAELKDTITDEEMNQIIAVIKEELPDGATQEMIIDAIALLVQSKNFVYKHFVNQ